MKSFDLKLIGFKSNDFILKVGNKLQPKMFCFETQYTFNSNCCMSF